MPSTGLGRSIRSTRGTLPAMRQQSRDGGADAMSDVLVLWFLGAAEVPPTPDPPSGEVVAVGRTGVAAATSGFVVRQQVGHIVSRL